MDTNGWRFYDTTLYVSFKERDDTAIYKEIRNILRTNGFLFHQDPFVKKNWPTLAALHHVGWKGDLHFASDLSPIGLTLVFHEDVVRDNSNGGRYHFDKMAKMPYLLRKRVLLIRNKITGRLAELGFKDETNVEPEDSFARVQYRREQHMKSHGKDAYKPPLPTYNTQAGDKTLLEDGQIRYFRTRSGRLKRGQIWNNINSMWWVILDKFRVYNVASFELFTFDPAKHKRKDPKGCPEKLRYALLKAVEKKQYYRAARMSDAMARLYPAEFKAAEEPL